VPSLRRTLLPLAAALILGLAAVIVVLLVTGGGSDKRLTEDEQAYVTDVCRALGTFAQDARPAVDQLGVASDLAGIEQAVERLQQAVGGLETRLEAIDPPEAVASEHEGTLAALGQASSSFADIAQALREGDTGRLEELVNSDQDLRGVFPQPEDYPSEFEKAFREDQSCRDAETFFEGGPQTQAERFAVPRSAEADDSPSLPGEFVDLVAIYGGPYGSETPNTNAHLRRRIDYATEQGGLPPAGGPHWGSGGCGSDPANAPTFCGPVDWGVYNQPWEAESLVHNMEHAGVVLWYNTNDQEVIRQLDEWAQANSDRYLVVAPYPELEPETVAISAWSRRDKVPAAPFDGARLQRFLDAHECRFDPERLCGRRGG